MSQPAPLTLRVVEVIPETADAHTLVLEPADGGHEKFRYKPGQFLTLRIPTDRPGGAARCYSLCSSPETDDLLKVTVKRTHGGYGSNWICDHVAEGDVLEVLRPSGTFTPASLDEDLLLVAGGSGITPVMSILKSVLYGGRGAVTLVYANRDEQSVIFKEALIALAKEYGDRLTVVHWLESVQGIPSEPALRSLLGGWAERHAYICGPGAFMDLAVATLTGLGTPAERVNVERFSSLATDPFAAVDPGLVDATGPASEVEVTLDGNTTTVTWPQSAKLLDVLLSAGLDAPYSCREGACSACACVLLDGEVELEHNEVLDQTDLGEGLILACQAVPLSERLKVTYDA